ncbi:sensor histidine kinase [Azotosporobacter soli]|uniref:sensor histidine kinase n=1 Tax=Azotosporobacter soli TaxID=3055040 RepID=UPI0031FEFF02
MTVKILIVDDSKTDRAMIQNFLAEHQLLLAENGKEAMEILAREQDIDMVILDLNMPQMNGFEVLEAMQRHPEHKKIATLILTNYDEPKNEIRGLELGAIDYITKPINSAVVKTRVNTHLKLKLQRDLLEKQKSELTWINEELEAFSYSVSHDLKVPLHIIKTYSEFLEKNLAAKEDAEGLDDIAMIKDSCQRMAQLIDDILQLAKVGQYEINYRPINLSELAKGIIEKLRILQPERQVEFLCEPELFADADSRLMEMAMFNLLQNAWKYTSRHSQACIEFGALKQADGVVYFVRDDGAGFEMKNAGELFKKIKRLHAQDAFEGTGVGLTIVDRIIKRHKGTIWAESEVEKGSTFYFKIEACNKKG